MTAVYPTHSWSSRDGAVNLLPKHGTPLLLNTPIERVSWDTTDLALVSVGRVFSLGAVKRRSAELGLDGQIVAVGLQRAPRVVDGVPQMRRGREWKIESVTLLAALNRIAASYGDVRW